MCKKLLTIEELSEYIGITVNTAYSWVSQKKIPYIKVGRLVRFDMDKINEWVEQNSVEVYSIEKG